MNGINDFSRNTTGKDIPDLIGNATETALHKSIQSSPIGKIPVVGKQLEGAAKNVASEVAKTVNNQVARRTGRSSSSQGGGGGASGMGGMKPPTNPNSGIPGSGSNVRKMDMVPTGNSYYPVIRQSINPEPYTYSLNTGINAPVYSPLYQNALSNSNASMCLQALTVNYTVDSYPISQFTQTVIFQVFYNAIQRAVSFSVGSSLTANNLIGWMDSLIAALSLYFFIKSILAYNNNPLNRNDAMNSLRNNISATDLNNLYELERLLLGTPIPPNLVNFIWWLNGNYLNGELPNSTILKFSPLLNSTYNPDAYSYNFNFDWTDIFQALNNFNNVSVLIARAVPDWVKGELPMYPDLPVYDTNWLTVFANVPFTCSNSTSIGFTQPSISTSTNSWSYYSYTNDLDGAALSLATVYDSTNAAYLPNLSRMIAIPYTTNSAYHTNRLLWCYNGSTSGWTDLNICNNIFPVFTYVPNPLSGAYAYYTSQNPSCQLTLGVNEASVTQAGLQLAEWLFSIDTIGYVQDRRVYDNRYDVSIGVPPKFRGKKK